MERGSSEGLGPGGGHAALLGTAFTPLQALQQATLRAWCFLSLEVCTTARAVGKAAGAACAAMLEHRLGSPAFAAPVLAPIGRRLYGEPVCVIVFVELYVIDQCLQLLRAEAPFSGGAELAAAGTRPQHSPVLTEPPTFLCCPVVLSSPAHEAAGVTDSTVRSKAGA